MRHITARHLVITLFLLCSAASSQAQSALPDVAAAFSRISAEPQVIRIARNNIHVPAGGHLQGIQQSPDSTFIITASSGSYAYYLTAKNGQFTSFHKIDDNPYRHAGGCQMSGHILFVGVEDNVAKDKSKIMVINHSTQGPEPIIYPIIHRRDIFKRSTAGAVGITLANTYYFLAVADWDSRNIDFYRCVDGNPKNFDSLSTFHASDHKDWCPYQSINLVSEVGGKLYMIGFGLDGTRNRADLFEVSFSAERTNLRLISTRYFRCRGASFRYGAGMGTTGDGKLVFYSCARNVSSHTAINIFK